MTQSDESKTLILVTRIVGADEWALHWGFHPRHVAVVVLPTGEHRSLTADEFIAPQLQEGLLTGRLLILHGADIRKLIPVLDHFPWPLLREQVRIFVHVGVSEDVSQGPWRALEREQHRASANYQAFLDLAKTYSVLGVDGLGAEIQELSARLRSRALSAQDLDRFERRLVGQPQDKEASGSPDWGLIFHRVQKPFLQLGISSQALAEELAAGERGERFRHQLRMVRRSASAEEQVSCLWLALLGWTFRRVGATWQRVEAEGGPGCGLPSGKSLRELVEGVEDSELDRRWSRLFVDCGLRRRSGAYSPNAESYLCRFAIAHDEAMRGIASETELGEQDVAALRRVPFSSFFAWQRELEEALRALKDRFDKI